MSKFIKMQKLSLHKLLKEDLYIKRASPLKELLGFNTSRNIKMKIFKILNNTTSKKAVINKENYYKKSNLSSFSEYKKKNLKELNESIINLFNKINYLQYKDKKIFEPKKGSR